MILDLKTITTAERQQWLQMAIAPRPIALASTISQKGVVNLAPFSFFNIFSVDPPILIFSPALRVRDNSRKHTLNNISEVAEVVIHIVDEAILDRVNQCGADYPEETDELNAVGFTAQPSTVVRPPRVKESKIQLECSVQQVISLGSNGGAGQLIVAEMLVMHIDESILNDQGKMDYQQFKPVARLGGDWYCTIKENNLFQLPKPTHLFYNKEPV